MSHSRLPSSHLCPSSCPLRPLHHITLLVVVAARAPFFAGFIVDGGPLSLGDPVLLALRVLSALLLRSLHSHHLAKHLSSLARVCVEVHLSRRLPGASSVLPSQGLVILLTQL